jgi:hypothetical protein
MRFVEYFNKAKRARGMGYLQSRTRNVKGGQVTNIVLGGFLS